MQDKILVTLKFSNVYCLIKAYVRAAEKEEVMASRLEETKIQSMMLLKQNITEKEKKIAELTRELVE